MGKATNAICSIPWAITQDYLRLMVEIAQRQPLSVETQTGRKLENTRTVEERDGVAIIPIIGPIARYMNLFSEISGGTSIQVLGKDLRTALNSQEIRAIILKIDSPGGEANGVNEFANMVYAARGRKPIVAYVGGIGASAAYWIASAADEIVIDDSALLGSIGTLAVMTTPDENEIVFVSSQSPRKHADPTTETGKESIQGVLDAMTEVFTSAVARNRGVTVEKVLSDFGQGGLLVGQAAVTAGLADRLGSFEATLADLAARSRMAEASERLQTSVTAVGAASVQAAKQQATLNAALAVTPPFAAYVPQATTQPVITLGGSTYQGTAPTHQDPTIRKTVRAAQEYLTDSVPSSTTAPGRARKPTTSKENRSMIEPTNDRPPGEDLVPEGVTEQVVIQAFAGMDEQLTARQMEMLQAQWARLQEQSTRQAEEMFARWTRDMEQRQKMTAWAQNATTPTMQRQHALSCTETELVALLAETPAPVRAKWQALIDHTLANGFVSFEEIGSSGGEAPEQTAKERFDAAVNAKVATGMSRYAAMQAVGKEQPELYAEYQAESSQRGAVALPKKGGK